MPDGARTVTSRILRFINSARLRFPAHYFCGSGGIGDDLLCTTVFREIRKRSHARIAVRTRYPELFHHSPDVDVLLGPKRPKLEHLLHGGLQFQRLGYSAYDPEWDMDEPPKEHVVSTLCRLAGIKGTISLRPYLYLTSGELARGRLAENHVVIQSSGRAAAFFMQNKEWYPERFQHVCDELRGSHHVIQLGSAQDPPLAGALDLRGKTNLRESAAILANSLVFVGQVGFLMHLSRAVDCRGVIVYGGRERPWQTGYISNANLIGDTACSPCWLRNRCDYEHACMTMISAEQVLAAAREAITKHPEPLEVETAEV